jgi:hypothetical protein
VLVVAVLAGFVLLFPLQLVRRFYALALPYGQLGTTALIALTGAAAVVSFWVISHQPGRVRQRHR